MKREPFTMINLAFPDNTATDSGLRSTRNQTRRIATLSVSLEELVSHHFRTEKLTGDNRYYCEKCGKLTEAERTNSLIEVRISTPSNDSFFFYPKKLTCLAVMVVLSFLGSEIFDLNAYAICVLEQPPHQDISSRNASGSSCVFS